MFIVTASDSTTGEFWTESFGDFAYAKKEAQYAQSMGYSVTIRRGSSNSIFPWNLDPYHDHTCTIQETPDGMGCVTCLYT